MKKRFNKKLSLKKLTLVNLTQKEKEQLKGGATGFCCNTTSCQVTNHTCPAECTT